MIGVKLLRHLLGCLCGLVLLHFLFRVYATIYFIPVNCYLELCGKFYLYDSLLSVFF